MQVRLNNNVKNNTIRNHREGSRQLNSSPISNNQTNLKKCSAGLMKAYFVKNNQPSFKGTPTNFNIIVKKQIKPLVIERGMDFDNLGISHYFPELKCARGDWSGSKVIQRFFKKAYLPNSNFTKAELTKSKFPKANLEKSDFRESYAVSADFRKARLEDSNFYNANIENANFQNANLRYVNFQNTHMPNVNLMGADMSYSDFSKSTTISGAIYDEKTIFPVSINSAMKADMHKMEKGGSLEGAVLHRAHIISDDIYQKDLSESNFEGATFRWSNINNIDFSKSNFADSFLEDTIFASVNFTKADLEDAKFERCNFQHTRFDEANLKGTMFKDSNLIGANFEDCDLNQTKFDGLCIYDATTEFPEGFKPEDNVFLKKLEIGANLSNTVMKKIKLRGEDMAGYEANLEKVNFTKADLSEAIMTDLNMKDCKFKKAYMREAVLSGSDLENADFRKANLEGVNFSNTTSKNTKLKGANFAWANLNKSITDGADFTGAKYSDDTIFPEGFDPVSRGMIKLEPQDLVD